MHRKHVSHSLVNLLNILLYINSEFSLLCPIWGTVSPVNLLGLNFEFLYLIFQFWFILILIFYVFAFCSFRMLVIKVIIILLNFFKLKKYLNNYLVVKCLKLEVLFHDINMIYFGECTVLFYSACVKKFIISLKYIFLKT